jgi:hypothetical protein
MQPSIRTVIMTRHYLTATIFLACLPWMFAGTANAQVIQCIDDDNAVTYTNVACQHGDDARRPAKAAAPGAAISSPASTRMATAPDPASIEAQANPHLALDVATLKAARSAMASLDRAALLSRQQKLAGIH